MNYMFLRAREEFQRDLMFRSLDRIGPVDLSKYEVIYAGECADDGQDQVILEGLFQTFNIAHPEDFRAASMSVGDIVMLGNARLWFCDSVGWVALTGENAPVAYSRVTLYEASRPARAAANRRAGR
jgi:hypothetical protein